MEIVINHLHRASPGVIGVSGLDASTGKHVTPLIIDQSLSNRHLLTEGGFFDLGCRVDLGSAQACGQKPHVEDYTFDPKEAVARDIVSSANFFQLMLHNAEPDLKSIFGPDLQPQGMSGWLVPAGRGQASVGLLAPLDPPELWVKPRPGDADEIRLTFRDRSTTRDLPVTDLRLFLDEAGTPRESEIDKLNEIMHSERRIVLGMALSRPVKYNGQESSVHWLYVTGIHWPASAQWRLATINALN